MKMETLKFKRANEKKSRLKRELIDAQNELQKIMDDTMIVFKESDDKEELTKKLKEISSEVFGERLTVSKEQIFLLSLKLFIIDDIEKERIYKISRYLFGDREFNDKTLSHLTVGEYKDYLLYILNKKMGVSEKELSELIHISEYSIKKNIEYRSKRGFRSFSK